MFRYALLLILLATTGCDRLTGAAQQKVSDAEAIGYACRVSFKKPEDCMKENDAQSPTSVLEGWKAADKDIQDKKLDPGMGATLHAASAVAATPIDDTATPDQPQATEKKAAK